MQIRHLNWVKIWLVHVLIGLEIRTSLGREPRQNTEILGRFGMFARLNVDLLPSLNIPGNIHYGLKP
jgi:hypothetical protein